MDDHVVASTYYIQCDEVRSLRFTLCAIYIDDLKCVVRFDLVKEYVGHLMIEALLNPVDIIGNVRLP